MMNQNRSALSMAAGGGDAAQIAQGMSPEQMAQFKQNFQVGQAILYDREVFGGLVQGVDGADAVKVLAALLVQVLEGIERKSGPLDVAVVLALGIALLNDVVDALRQTGRPGVDAEQAEQALSLGVQLWLGSHPGRVPPEAFEQLRAQFGGAEAEAGAGPAAAPGMAAGPGMARGMAPAGARGGV